MAGVVWFCEGSDSVLAGPNTVSFAALALYVLIGAVTYTVVLSVAWLASGRPGGAEAYAVNVLRSATRALLARRGVAR